MKCRVATSESIGCQVGRSRNGKGYVIGKANQRCRASSAGRHVLSGILLSEVELLGRKSSWSDLWPSLLASPSTLFLRSHRKGCKWQSWYCSSPWHCNCKLDAWVTGEAVMASTILWTSGKSLLFSATVVLNDHWMSGPSSRTPVCSFWLLFSASGQLALYNQGLLFCFFCFFVFLAPVLVTWLFFALSGSEAAAFKAAEC